MKSKLPSLTFKLNLRTLLIFSACLSFGVLSGCTSGLKSDALSTTLMPNSAKGVCAIGYDKPFRATKGECFDQHGLFEQTDNPETVIANYVPPKRPPKPVIKPVAQEPAQPPSEAKQKIEAAEARGDEKAPCYLKGSDKPFMMAKSICTSSGGKLSP